jgi:predicted enzyme related to lactoylglutathione lyase
MATSALNLVVIRSSDIDKSAAFYSALGITFSKHSHGNGPEHYASEGDGVTFEIYPEADSAGATTATRLGFKVTDVDALLPILVEKGGLIASPAKDSPWGRRAVVVDPTGHKVELVQG